MTHNYEKIIDDMVILNKMEYCNDKDIYISSIELLNDNKIMIKSPIVIIDAITKNNNDILITFKLKNSNDMFTDHIEQVEDTLKKTLIKNSETIFGRAIQEKKLHGLFKSLIKRSETHTTFDAIIDMSNIHVLSKSNEELDINTIKQDNEVELLLNISHIEFYRDKIQPITKLHKIKVYNQISQINEYMFNDSDID